MKRLAIAAALAGGLCGCVPGGNFLLPTAPPADKAAVKADARPAYKPPVVAAQVTGDNAKEKAGVLNEEMDRDLQATIEGRDKK